MPIQPPQFNVPAFRPRQDRDDPIGQAFNQALNYAFQSRLTRESAEERRRTFQEQEALRRESGEQSLANRGTAEGVLIPRSEFSDDQFSTLEETAQNLNLAPPTEIKLDDRTFVPATQVQNIQETQLSSQRPERFRGRTVLGDEEARPTRGELEDSTEAERQQVLQGDVEAARAQVRAIQNPDLRDSLMNSLDSMEESQGGFSLAEQERVPGLIEDVQASARFDMELSNMNEGDLREAGEVRQENRRNFGIVREDGSIRPYKERELDIIEKEAMGESLNPSEQATMDFIAMNERPRPEPLDMQEELLNIITNAGSTDPSNENRLMFSEDMHNRMGDNEAFMDRVEQATGARTAEGIRSWATQADSRIFRQAWALRKLGVYTMEDLDRLVNQGVRLPFGMSGTVEASRRLYPEFDRGGSSSTDNLLGGIDLSRTIETRRRRGQEPRTEEDVSEEMEEVRSRFAPLRENLAENWRQQMEAGGRLVRMELVNLGQQMTVSPDSAAGALRQRADGINEQDPDLAEAHREMARIVQDNPELWTLYRDSILVPAQEEAGILPQ